MLQILAHQANHVGLLFSTESEKRLAHDIPDTHMFTHAPGQKFGLECFHYGADDRMSTHPDLFIHMWIECSRFAWQQRIALYKRDQNWGIDYRQQNLHILSPVLHTQIESEAMSVGYMQITRTLHVLIIFADPNLAFDLAT